MERTLVHSIDPSSKPTLADLLNQHRLNTGRLAKTAQAQLSTIQALLKEAAVSPVLAEQVLTGVYLLAGVHYSLADVHPSLWQEEGQYAHQN